MAHHIDQIILRHLAQHHWLAQKSELVALGVSPRSVERRVASGVLTAFGNGVVGIANQSDPPHQAMALGLAMHPAGALSHFTACDLEQIPARERRPGTSIRIELPIDLVIPHASSRVATSLRIHQSRSLPAVDIAEKDGWRRTTVERTVCDLAPIVSLAKLSWLIEWVIKEGLADRGSIQACARSLNRQGRPGTVKRRMALTNLLDDEPLDLSELERRFLALAATLGIQGLEFQFQPPWYDGIKGIIDFAIPHLMIIIEVDGRRWHSLTQDQRRDRERDRVGRTNGWLILRYGWDELLHRPEEVAADLLAAIDREIRIAA